MDSFPLYDAVGVVICLGLSAFFSGTETALTALTEFKVMELSERFRFISSLLKGWLEDPGFLLSTVLIGNNLVNIIGTLLIGKVTSAVLAQYGALVADTAAVASMTLMVLIFGEVTPKTFAKLYPDRFIVPALYVLRPLSWILYPFAKVLGGFAHWMISLTGSKDVGSGTNITQTDIEYLIKKGSNMGVFEQEEQAELLSSVIEFKDTMVKEIMIPRTDAHFLDIETSISEALDRIEEWGHSRLPVYEESLDNIRGLLYTKDLISLLQKKDVNLDQTVAGLLRDHPVFVPETQKIHETLKVMQARRKHMAIVVDEFGGTAGLITLEDILEELVGDIKDEDDHEDQVITKIKDGVYAVDAHISISDLAEELDITIPEDGEYNSLGGFLTAIAGSVPKRGYTIERDGWKYTVVESDERHIVRVELHKKQ